jgi:DNA polymerase zeta
MKLESKSQKKPVFEAKGLETVRRDQCALTQKVLRNALITLFRDGKEAVKDYLYRQWSLIFSGQLPVSDFVLTGRVRSRYRGGREGPVQAVLARRIGEADPGRIIRHMERLPYVIVAIPGITFRLKDCVLTPLELLERWDAYAIHSAYYIQKVRQWCDPSGPQESPLNSSLFLCRNQHVNASLQRCLGLAPHFIDVNVWYQACPKPRRRIHFWPVRSKSRAMISSYFGSDVCSLCHRRCMASGRDRVVVCSDCRRDEIKASQSALLMLNKSQQLAHEAARECSNCNHCFEHSGTFAAIRDDEGNNGPRKTTDFSRPLGAESLQLPLANCVCIDCPTTYLRHRLREHEIEANATCEALGAL